MQFQRAFPRRRFGPKQRTLIVLPILQTNGIGHASAMKTLWSLN